ncbi:MAG: PqqD family peptide modification chaperone [Rhodocyclaceae bacterium]|nr:PqqD family peptide modification chaperone [Rhodocyclaceae bacterium]
MRPAEGTHLFFLDNVGVLFDERSQKIFQLNTTAAFIWCQLEDGADLASIDRALQQTFAMSTEEARACRAQTEGLLRSAGVLRGSEAPAPAATSAPDSPAVRVADALFVAQARYRLLSAEFRLRFTSDAQLRKVAPVLAHLQVADSGQDALHIDIVEDGTGGLAIHEDCRPVLGCRNLYELAPLIKGLIWQCAITRHDFFLDIHAGVVGDGERCVLFPAAPGSGKSTLTTALAHHGFEYFSDEVALLHLPDLQVEAVPLATCVKDSGVGALARFYPALADTESHLRGDGKRVRYVAPPAAALPPAGTRRPVGAIVFPRYTPGDPGQLERLSPNEALTALMAECLIVATRLDAAKVRQLLQWISATPCYRLPVCDLDVAVEAVRALSSGRNASSAAA